MNSITTNAYIYIFRQKRYNNFLYIVMQIVFYLFKCFQNDKYSLLNIYFYLQIRKLYEWSSCYKENLLLGLLFSQWSKCEEFLLGKYSYNSDKEQSSYLHLDAFIRWYLWNKRSKQRNITLLSQRISESAYFFLVFKNFEIGYFLEE